MLKTKVIVDVSDAAVSDDPNDIIITYSLASCIAVSLYDPNARIGGMLHYQLPQSKIEPDRAKQKPLMFADTGMQILTRKLEQTGANKKRLQVKIAGGAAMEKGPKGFDIGKRNYLAIRKLLWKKGMFIQGEDVGGQSPRNMQLDIADGTVTVKSNGIEKNL